jgi:D-alanyl-D-alanine carboxypeptidase
MSPNNFKKLIYAMFTATVTGIVLSFIAIFLYSIFSEPELVSSETPTIVEEEEEDPTFTSRFSRVMIYSNDDSREIIESAKRSLPTTGLKPVSAPGYMVMNMDSNLSILEKNPDKLFPIASVTKLVTAVVSRKLLKQNEFVTISKDILSTYGNEAKLRRGEKLKVNELIYPLLIVSSNDSAEALAGAYTLGRQKFIKEMNNWVNSIGAYRTYFRDPSGLSSQNVSTPNDLAIITKWILENDPEIFDITMLKSKTIRTHTWTNPAHFLNLTAYAGGKNGYIPEAKRTSVSLFKLGKQEHLFAVILLGSATRDNDILDLLDEAVR